MRTRTRIVATTATALALAGLAGCGGSSDTVTQTVTTDDVPTTAPTTAATTTAAPTTSATPATIGDDRLPPAGTLDGTESGTSRPLSRPRVASSSPCCRRPHSNSSVFPGKT